MTSIRAMVLAAASLALAASAVSAAPGGKPSLKAALAKLPPAWVANAQPKWNMNRPWSEARLEVRRLLGGDAKSVDEAMKLTYLYNKKGDIGNGHEWPMYLFMGGEYAWAVQEYPPHLKEVEGKGPTHEYLCYASCLAHFGEYQRALAVLDKASKDLPPAPWQISCRANIADAYGDLYADMGDIAKAKQHYAEAVRLYPTSDQPYGRHLLARQAAKVQTKLDLLTMASLATARLRDGTYIGRSLGYADQKDMEVTVRIAGGRIADVSVKHEEKIELGATTIIPKRIIAKQSLKVDAVTGATVTCQAIVDGAYSALKQAGLK